MADDTNASPRTGLADCGLRVANESFHWRIPSRPELVEKIVMELKERAEACGICNAERGTALVIALSEAITNAIVHGNLEISSALRERTDGSYGRMLAQRCADPAYVGRDVQIDVQYDGSRCTWTVTDEGKGFDVECVLHRLEQEVEPDELASGRGLLLMRALMDEATWSHGGRQVRLTLCRHGAAGGQRVRLCAPTTAEGIPAVATSLSHDGLHLVGNQPLPFKQLLVEVEVQGHRETLPAEVRQILPLGGDWLQIDCRFPQPESAERPPSFREAIDRILAACTRRSDPGHEQRSEERYAYTDRIRIERRGGSFHQAIARNISKSGLGFIGNFTLDKGEPFTLALEPDGHAPLRVSCEVIRCQRLSGNYHDFGVRFVERRR